MALPIRVYDYKMNFKGYIYEYEKFKFTDRLNDIGSFSFTTPYSPEVIDLITEDMNGTGLKSTGSFLYMNGEIYGKVDSWTIDLDTKTVSVAGSSLEVILSWRQPRMMLHQDSSAGYFQTDFLDMVGGSSITDYSMVWLFYYTFCNSADPVTYYPTFSYDNMPYIASTSATKQIFDGGDRSLLEAFQGVSNQYDMKFKLYMDFYQNKIMFRRNYMSSYPKFFLSDTKDKLTNVRVTLSDKDVANGGHYWCNFSPDTIRWTWDLFSSNPGYYSNYWCARQSTVHNKNNGYFFRPEVGRYQPLSENIIRQDQPGYGNKYVDHTNLEANIDGHIKNREKNPTYEYSCVAEIPDARVGDMVQITDSRFNITTYKRITAIQYVVVNDSIQKICTFEEYTKTPTRVNCTGFLSTSSITVHAGVPTRFYAFPTPYNTTETLTWTTNAGVLEVNPGCMDDREAYLTVDEVGVSGTVTVKSSSGKYHYWNFTSVE